MIDGLKPYPTLKDSGVPWLDKVPEHWDVRRIKALFREKDQRNGNGDALLLSLTRARGIIPQTQASRRIASAEDLSKYKVCRAGDLVMNRMQAWSGMFAVSPQEGVISPDYSVFGPIDSSRVEFFEHLFKTPLLVNQFAQRSKGIGSGFNRLYTPDFGSIPVAVPPVPEQTAIVRFLVHADARIRHFLRAKQKLIKLLEEERDVIIHHAITRGLNPEVRLKPSGVQWLGELPEHWEIRRAKAVCSAIIDCKNRTPEAIEDGDYTVVRTTCVRNGQFDPSGGYRTDEKNFRVWTARGAPHVGDVFFTREAPAGEACLVPERNDLCMGQRIMYFRPDPEILDARFLLLNVYGPLTRTYVELATNGSTVGHLRLGQVNALPIIWCPVDEQRAIIDFVDLENQRIEGVRETAVREIELLREYRIRLFADVVTGKLDVREAAARLPEEVPEVEPLDEMEDMPEDESVADDEELTAADAA
jgi:type I restriction enzyme S subunit